MTVVLLSSDLAVLSRVEGAVMCFGETIRQATAGPQAAEVCEREGARLLVADLSGPAIDIAEVINLLKQNPSANPRVIAFGPHVHEQRLAEVRSAGCEVVVTRGQFFSQLDLLLKPDA